MSNKDVWKMLANEKKTFPEDFGTPVSDGEIASVEKSLRIKLHDQYKYFLREYGGVLLTGYVIIGVKNIWGDSNIEKNTKFYKEEQKWPGIDDWYIISDDGSGNPIGIKPDGSVWLSDHDHGFEQIKLADDFEDFIYKLLTDTLYD